MPIYDYKCSKCDHQFEVIQKFSDDPLKKCPECNNNSISKMVSAPSFRLKGGGCLLYTSPSPRDAHESRMPSSA